MKPNRWGYESKDTKFEYNSQAFDLDNSWAVALTVLFKYKGKTFRIMNRVKLAFILVNQKRITLYNKIAEGMLLTWWAEKKLKLMYLLENTKIKDKGKFYKRLNRCKLKPTTTQINESLISILLDLKGVRCETK